MAVWVGLLRGINVGGKGTLPMKDLVEIADGLGWENIQTYIQSGNLIFNADKPNGDNLRDAIQARMGFAPQVMVLSRADFENVVEACPLESITGTDLHVYFLGARSHANALEFDNIKLDSERWALRPNAFYLFAPYGIAHSKLATRAEKILGVPATARNWNTVMKLQGMLKQ